jgi:hypothetical protein
VAVFPADAEVLVARIAAGLEDLAEASRVADAAAVDGDHVARVRSIGMSLVVHGVLLSSASPWARAICR